MDSFELNKVAGAVLGALLFAVGSGFVAELIYHPKPAGSAGYALPEPEPKAAASAAAAPKAEPVAVRLASADADKGKGGTKACAACHSFEKGGPNKVGPDLWDVVEREKAHAAGFEYSAGLKEKGGTWTYEDLDHFLENPKGYAKGTKMAFAGIGSPTERANVIAYLRTLSDSPKPLPVAEKKDEAAKPAEGEKKPAEAEKKAEGEKPAAKPPESKPPESKPADKAPESQTGDKDKKPETNAPQGAEGDGKGTARPVPAPEVQPQRNEVAPPQAPEAKPSGDVDTQKAPASPEAPAATEAPAKADPEAPKP
ncbi:c-type cytochrome [Methylobacterium sp. Leaf118]|uniref:c-type cytochrome n=1 Tax=Methylobacterium sp. Leaf118 TaxID=2876562 RepID=UPI001E5FB400|nr:cytochrome c family protein [Methylobacterium sp. Leaf118]